MKARGKRRGEKRATKDVMVLNNGSTVSLMALTPKAKRWCLDRLPDDCPTMGESVFVVEPRCAPDILAGMRGDGLAVD